MGGERKPLSDNGVNGDSDMASDGGTLGTEVDDEVVRGLADEQDIDLREALAALSQLSMGLGGLSTMLVHVADFAVRAIPAADGVGVMVVHDNRPNTVVASADFVDFVDAIQYELGEGPCVSAAATASTVVSDSLGSDGRWPRFGERARDAGVQSALALPLTTASGVVGALNVYAHDEAAFDDRAVTLGEWFALPAAVSVHNAQRLDQARRATSQLETALGSRATIDRAVGIVMSRSGCTPEEGFDSLRTISQNENRKLSAVARQVVDDAVRRARARHLGP